MNIKNINLSVLLHWLVFSFFVSLFPFIFQLFMLIIMQQITLENTFLYKPDFFLYSAILILNVIVTRDASKKYPNNKDCTVVLVRNRLTILIDLLRLISYLLLICSSGGYVYMSIPDIQLGNNYVYIVITLFAMCLFNALCLMSLNYPKCEYPRCKQTIK